MVGLLVRENELTEDFNFIIQSNYNIQTQYYELKLNYEQ